MALHLALNQTDNVIDYIVDVERCILRICLLGQRTQSLDHLACAIAVPDHALNGAARFLKVRRLVAEPSERSFTIGDDGGKWLVDLVRNRRGQFAKRGHARYMSKLCLCLMQRFLRTLF